MGSARKYFFEKYKEMKDKLENSTLICIESRYGHAKNLLECAFGIELIDVDEFHDLLSELNHEKSERFRFLYKQEKKDAIEKYGNDKELVEIYCRFSFKELGLEAVYNEMIAEEKVEAEFERVKAKDVSLCDDEEDLVFYLGYFECAENLGIISEDRLEEMGAELSALFKSVLGNSPAGQELHIE